MQIRPWPQETRRQELEQLSGMWESVFDVQRDADILLPGMWDCVSKKNERASKARDDVHMRQMRQGGRNGAGTRRQEKPFLLP